MEAKDLMIGDWVELYGTPTRWELEDYAKWYKEMERTDVHTFEPIPLTKEILEKNGFEKDKYGYFIYKDYDEEVAVWFRDSFAEITHVKYIFNPEDVTEVDFDESLTFKKCYVHNLQHALRDFKLDKKIEL